MVILLAFYLLPTASSLWTAFRTQDAHLCAIWNLLDYLHFLPIRKTFGTEGLLIVVLVGGDYISWYCNHCLLHHFIMVFPSIFGLIALPLV